MGSNRMKILEDLAEAAQRSIAANALDGVDRNGKQRVSLEKVHADTDMKKCLEALNMPVPTEKDELDRFWDEKRTDTERELHNMIQH